MRQSDRTQTSRLFRNAIPSGRRIRQARELSGLTQMALAEKIGVSQGLIAQIEGEFKLASHEVVQRIALHTKKFQPSFFYADPLIEFPPESVMFRAMASMTRAEETEARRFAEVVSELARILLGHIKTVEFSLQSAASSSPAEVARKVRSLMRLPADQPIGHLVREIEKAGVLVLALPMDLPKRDALSLWSEEIKMPVIVMSGGRSGDRIRLSAAHELGHIALGHSRVLNSADEQHAYEFAAELLMPEVAMRREIIPPVTLSVLASLKPRWRVSMQALLRRGKDLGILDESRARYLYTQISVKGWRKKEPIEIPVERPRLLRQLMERFYPGNEEALSKDLGYRPEFVRDILNCYDEAKDEREYPAKVIALKKR